MKFPFARTLLLLCAACAAVTVGARTGEESVDGFAAAVNDRIITLREVYQLAATEQPGAAGRTEAAFQRALTNLIHQALILEEFELSGGAVPERVVQDQADQIIRTQFQNNRSAFLEALQSQGLTRSEWLEDTKDGFALNILRRQYVTDRLKVNPLEVYRRYDARRAEFTTPDQVKLSMLTIKPRDGVEAAARAVEAHRWLTGGTGWVEVAKAFSSDAHTARGGEWGWVKPQDFRAELAAALAVVKKGELAPVVETDDACYVLQVQDSREAGTRPFEEVRARLEDEVRREEADRLFSSWMRRLKTRHYVTIY